MSGEVLIRCPECGDHRTHNHCYVNTEKGVWHCHFCGQHGTVKALAKNYPHIYEIADLVRLSALSAPSSNASFFTLGATLPVLLPEQRWAEEFLRKRGLTISEMVRFRVCTSAALPRRVVFPEYIGKAIAFWSARSVKKEFPKWLFPKNGTTLKRKSESVWGLGSIKEGADIWVAEGVFDAIAVNGVCIYGKMPSNIQLQMILSKRPSEITVAFDQDAPDEAERLALRLKGIVKVDIQFPKLKDYGAYLQAGWRRIEGSKKFRKGETT